MIVLACATQIRCKKITRQILEENLVSRNNIFRLHLHALCVLCWKITLTYCMPCMQVGLPQYWRRVSPTSLISSWERWGGVRETPAERIILGLVLVREPHLVLSVTAVDWMFLLLRSESPMHPTYRLTIAKFLCMHTLHVNTCCTSYLFLRLRIILIKIVSCSIIWRNCEISFKSQNKL